MIQRKEKEQKKEQVKRLKEIEKAKKALVRQRRLSNPLDPLPKNSILRDIMNIYTPAYSSIDNCPNNNQICASQLQLSITPSKEQGNGGSGSNNTSIANVGLSSNSIAIPMDGVGLHKS